MADPRYHLLQCAFERSQKLGQTRVLSTLILFLLRPDYKSFLAFNRIYGLLKVVFMQKRQCYFSVQVQEHADVPDAVHRVDAVSDVVEVLDQRVNVLFGPRSQVG